LDWIRHLQLDYQCVVITSDSEGKLAKTEAYKKAVKHMEKWTQVETKYNEYMKLEQDIALEQKSLASFQQEFSDRSANVAAAASQLDKQKKLMQQLQNCVQKMSELSKLGREILNAVSNMQADQRQISAATSAATSAAAAGSAGNIEGFDFNANSSVVDCSSFDKLNEEYESIENSNISLQQSQLTLKVSCCCFCCC
jgi:oligoendopeptidase F